MCDSSGDSSINDRILIEKERILEKNKEEDSKENKGKYNKNTRSLSIKSDFTIGLTAWKMKGMAWKL